MTDILDTGPQIRVDYANHIAEGTLLWLLASLLIGPWWSLIGLTIVIIAKKLYDHYAEKEPVTEVFGKIVVTIILPILAMLLHYYGNWTVPAIVEPLLHF